MGSRSGTVGTILARIGDNKQAAGVSIGVAQNGRLFLQSAFMNNTAKGYDAWIKDKSSHVLSAPKGPRNASSSLSISNIKDIFGFVNKDFHVTEGLPKTGFPYSMFFYKANTKANTNNTSGGATVQKNEPAGDYIMYDSAKGGTHRDGFKYGHITFNNPLVLEYTSSNPDGWRKTLSEMFNGKSGRDLSNAIKSKGYDGLIAVNSKTETIEEVVNFTGKRVVISYTNNTFKKNGITKTELQSQGNAIKGSIGDTLDGQRLIRLFETADQSTFMHEMAHMFLLELQDIAALDPESREAKDLATLVKWAEYKPGQSEEYKGTASEAEFWQREEAIKAAEKRGETVLFLFIKTS